MKVLSHKETYYFVGGADDAWITHLFGGHQNMNIIGEKIQKDALAALAQPVYESRVNRKKVFCCCCCCCCCYALLIKK